MAEKKTDAFRMSVPVLRSAVHVTVSVRLFCVDHRNKLEIFVFYSKNAKSSIVLLHFIRLRDT